MSRPPNRWIQKISNDYRSKYLKRSPRELCRPMPVEAATAMAIADAFENARHEPRERHTRRCYEALCVETRRQWDVLVTNGLVAEPWTNPGQPYRNSAEMMSDVRGRHLFFFLTSVGHGEADVHLDQSPNPLMFDAGVRANGIDLCFNDVFRVVHDVFGHAAEGFQFGPQGEENAWRIHSWMYSWTARRAMTTETRGQNCWFNFGPHLRNEKGQVLRKGELGYLDVTKRPYADQKVTLLPKWITRC